jgi:hypothetical protein
MMMIVVMSLMMAHLGNLHVQRLNRSIVVVIVMILII